MTLWYLNIELLQHFHYTSHVASFTEASLVPRLPWSECDGVDVETFDKHSTKITAKVLQ